MASRLTGTLHMFPAHALYVGPLLAVPRHQHHAGQILWAPAGIDLAEEREPARRERTHVVAPNRPHRHGGATMAAVLWVDREDLDWTRAPSSPTALGAQASLDRELDADAASALADALLALVTPPATTRVRRGHPAVRRMCHLLDASVGQDGASVTDLARGSGLSVRQLRHRFTEELGINPSAYLRWRRLLRAIDAIQRGATLTEGALVGGFADGAHFSRVFQAQFGMAPSHALSLLAWRPSLSARREVPPRPVAGSW